MRILFISFHSPPNNMIGAVRVGKTLKYLSSLGHEIRLVTAHDTGLPTLPLEFPEESILRTPWVDLTRYEEHPNRWIRIACNTVQYRVMFPDKYISWYPHALAAGSRCLKHWRPDVIYASAPPYTSLLVARTLSRRHRIPWVAELRDLWSDNRRTGMNRELSVRMERRILQAATGIVTTTETASELLRNRYHIPIATVYNGFDPPDYPVMVNTPENSPGKILHILHTGDLYGGDRDPSALFQGILRLGDLKERVRVIFYGIDAGGIDACRVTDLIDKLGITNQVSLRPSVPYVESLRKQMEADVLLLLTHRHPVEYYTIAGKLFEYIGARRPILMSGYEKSAALQLLQKHQIGVFANDPEQIAEQLRQWIQQKGTGGVPSPPLQGTEMFTREEQTRHLSQFLTSSLRLV